MSLAQDTFAPLIRDVAVALLGDPDHGKPGDDTLRWGSRGSFKVDIPEGVWHDKAANVGGGVIDLIMRERRCDKVGALKWLEGEGMIEPREKAAKTFYDYTDERGAVVFRVERLGKGHVPPFLQHGPDGRGGFICRKGCMNGVRKVPYRLDRLVKADPSAVVFWTEGEKDCDRLISLGLVATTNPGGAAKFNGLDSAIAKHFPGRRVVILEDNDEAGANHVAAGSAALRPHVAAVAGLLLSGLPPKGDVSDWISAGGTAQELIALAERALVPADIDVLECSSPDAECDWPALDLRACANSPAPAREWVIEGWIPANKATLLAGDGGVGKSLLAQIKATCIAIGRPFMGMATRQANAAYASWEDDADELWRRQESICETMGIPMGALAGRLHLVSYTEEENPFLVTADENGVRVTPLGRKIERLVERHKVGLLILDNASQIAGIDHNAVDEVAPFAHWLGTLAKRNDGAVVLLHHTNKAGQDYLGSVAYNNQFRSRMLLARPDESHDLDVRVLTNPKANYAQAGNGIEIRWFKGAFVRDEDLPQGQRAELAEVGRANAENAAFLRCLAQRTIERRHVSEKVGANYAPKLFATMPEAKGVKKERLIAAMDRLFRIGAIDRGFLWRDTAEGKDIFGLRETGNVTGNVPENHSADDRKPAENDRKIHPVYINISGAALGEAAPVDEGERGLSKSGPSYTAPVSPDLENGPDDDLDADGNILGWSD